MPIEHPETADPTRRALLAVLSGGLASATPAAGKKDKWKPRPPLVAALARIDQMARLNDEFILLVSVEAFDLRTDPAGGFSLSQGAQFAGGGVERMRAALLRAVADADTAGVPSNRVAVLFL